MVNYNPETVSTDYDICDRLYFDELSFERVLDIYEKEKPLGVLLSMGGQIPNNIALRCHRAGVRVLGTPPPSIDRAEDRFKFSKLLDELGVDQPAWRELRSVAEAKRFARAIGYPVLIRPSYVLSGAAMSVVFNEDYLDRYLQKASRVSPEYPVVISKFILNAKEIELDAVADRGRGRRLGHRRARRERRRPLRRRDHGPAAPEDSTSRPSAASARSAARSPGPSRSPGPFNIQFIAKDNAIKVIECNLRASRSFPFVSKVARTNFVELAVAAIMGRPVRNRQDDPRPQLRRGQGAAILLLPAQGRRPRRSASRWPRPARSPAWARTSTRPTSRPSCRPASPCRRRTSC